MDKNKREKKRKKLEYRTFSSTKQEGVQSNDFPVPPPRYWPFDESRPSGLGLRRRASTFENDQASEDGSVLYELISKYSRRLEERELQGDFGYSWARRRALRSDSGYPPTLQERVRAQVGGVGDDYEDIEIDAASGTVPYSREGEEIDGSLKQSSSTTTSTNEDERENVSLRSEESEIVSEGGLIDDLSIGHFELQSARQDKNEIQPTARFPGNENFSWIEIEEDSSNIDATQMKGKVVGEKQINDIRASLGSNKIIKSCSGVHKIKNENSKDDHKAYKKNCGNQKDALEWIFMIANFLLELPSAFLDQLASVHKPQYALCAMLISVAALLICIVELIFRARKEKVSWKWRGRLLPCFYPRHNQKLFDTFKDNIIGVVAAFCHVIIITINYVFLRQGAGKPIQICAWPIIFSLGQICSKIL